jgi:hypothetical protein
MEPEKADEIRQTVSDKTGIPARHIMLALSHTHSGPVTSEKYTETTGEEAAAVRRYMTFLKKSITAVCAEAASRLNPGKMYETTYKTVLGYNRRYSSADETGGRKAKMLFNMWKNPGHPVNGTVDENIPVLLIEKIDDGSEDFYINQNGIKYLLLYSPPYHPVVLWQHSRMVSADYVGAARKTLENILDGRTKAMFLYGASGNVEPALACQCNPASKEIVGNAIAYGIAVNLALRKPVETGSIRILEEDVYADDSKKRRIKVQTIILGDACIAGVSGECFTELGIEIRRASPFKQTLVATNTNGGRGYLPVREAFSEGGHEVISAREMGYGEELFDRVLETVRKHMSRLKDGSGKC